MEMTFKKVSSLREFIDGVGQELDDDTTEFLISRKDDKSYKITLGQLRVYLEEMSS